MKEVLLVIDMLADFMEEGGALFCGHEARATIPFVQDKIAEIRGRGGIVIYVTDAHDPDDREFELFPAHAVRGSEGGKVIAEIAPQSGDRVIPKTRLSSFYDTDLDSVLCEEHVERVHVVGVCTSICIMDAVGDLHNRHIETIVYKDGVADFDPEAHEFALKRMEKVYGAKVV